MPQAPASQTAATNVSMGGGQADLLQGAIQAILYDRCYAGRRRDSARGPLAQDPAFTQRLADANASRERWDKGWVIHQVGPAGQFYARKGDRERIAIPGAFIAEAMIGVPPHIGTSISIRTPRESLDAQAGYYFAFGETLDEMAEQLSLVRFYFHCGTESGVMLMRNLTKALNRFQVPFQFKLPAVSAAYDRTDTAVLYVAARYCPITMRLLPELREGICLEPTVPLFTKQLWPGIGVAVDPGAGESFGMNRCRLAAAGIIDAWRAGKQDSPSRIGAVAALFSKSGLDLARPYLGPGDVDLFAYPEPPALP